MNILPRPLPLCFRYVQQRTTPITPPREQDPALLETLPDGAGPVRRPIDVSLGVIRGRDLAVLRRGEVPAREDVRRWEGARCADAVEKEDLVGW